jgi:hypothetical protein
MVLKQRFSRQEVRVSAHGQTDEDRIQEALVIGHEESRPLERHVLPALGAQTPA